MTRAGAAAAGFARRAGRDPGGVSILAGTTDWRPGYDAAGRGESGERSVGSFFRILEIRADEAASHPDAFDRIRAGAIHGVVLHGVYDADVLRSVVDRLERHDPPFLKTWFPEEFRSWFFGRNLNLTDPDLRGYFAEALAFREHIGGLFPPTLGVDGYLAGILAALDHGRPFRAAPGPDAGEHYMFTTVRAHLPGGFIPAHFDNEMMKRRSYRHLRGIVEPEITSFVLALTMAEAGGALEVYHHSCGPLGLMSVDEGKAAPVPDVGEMDSVTFRLPPGSMIVLESGRRLHRVTPVEGARKRWTLCSFMAPSRARDAMYCWG